MSALVPADHRQTSGNREPRTGNRQNGTLKGISAAATTGNVPAEFRQLTTGGNREGIRRRPLPRKDARGAGRRSDIPRAGFRLWGGLGGEYRGEPLAPPPHRRTWKTSTTAHKGPAR